MPPSSREDPRFPDDRDRQPIGTASEDPRHSDMRGTETATQPHDSHDLHDAHAGYDAELNPIDDELINTLGSER